VLPLPSDSGAVEKSFRNIRGVRVAYARSLGVYEVISADHLVITESALDVVEGSPAKEHAEEPAAKERAEEPAPMGSAPAKASTETAPEGEAEPTTEAATTEAGGEAE
jgi:hypothetical protein